MKVEQFEDLCRQSKFRPIKRIRTKHGNILIAETCSRPDFDGDIDGPHWQTLWAVERDDMDAAQPLHFADLMSSQRGRIDATVAVAMEWLSANLEGGRYDA